MKFIKTKKEAESYGDLVIEKAQKNLNLTGFAQPKRKINSSKKLSKSLYYEIEEDKKKGNLEQYFRSKVYYMAFVQEGVNGFMKSHKAPFSFKNNGKLPIPAILKWIEEKPNFKLQKTRVNKFGQKVSSFAKTTGEEGERNKLRAAFGIAIRLKERGKKPTYFYSEAMEETNDGYLPKWGVAIAADLATAYAEKLKEQGINAKQE